MPDYPPLSWEDLYCQGVVEMSDGYLEGGMRVPPETPTRSLGTIANVQVLHLYVDDSYERRQFRMDFVDDTGTEYRRFPINDLAHGTALQRKIEALDESRAERVALRAIRLTERVYLRIGLARPEELGDYPAMCWTQVTRVHTFPDYLDGKTFADFS